MKRAVIFDFGGVLMKTVDYSPRHAWDERLGLPPGSVESIVHGSAVWHKAQMGQISVADYWAEVARQLHIDPAEIGRFELDYFSGDRLDERLIAYIRALRQQGHQIALLSNDSAALGDKLRSLRIANLFDPLMISAQIGVMKPDPASFQAVLAALQRAPAETIFIDDRLDNVAAANSLGIHGVHYVSSLDLPTTLAPLLEIR